MASPTSPSRQAPGSLLSVQLCTGKKEPMEVVASVEVRADHGLVGDSHARPGSRRQVLLADAAVLAAEGLRPGEIRENLTVRGLAVDGLPPGTRIRVGASVILRVSGPCEPCGFLETLREGLQEVLRGRRGTLASVESGGTLAPGDPVAVLDPDRDSGGAAQ